VIDGHRLFVQSPLELHRVVRKDLGGFPEFHPEIAEALRVEQLHHESLDDRGIVAAIVVVLVVAAAEEAGENESHDGLQRPAWCGFELIMKINSRAASAKNNVYSNCNVNVGGSVKQICFVIK